jgi:hypothetical protein
LRILNLSRNKIGDGGMARLLVFRMLSELRVGDNEITDAGVKAVSVLNALTVLGLAENPGVTDQSVEYLARLSRLRELDLTGTSLTTEGLQRLRAQLPRCQILTADSGSVQEAVPLVLESGIDLLYELDAQASESLVKPTRLRVELVKTTLQ